MGALRIEREVTIGDLEMEIMKMDKEIAMLEAELKKAERGQAQGEQFSSLWREYLDEANIEDDSKWESEARQILWTNSDAEKQIAVEGYDRSEVEPIPF